MRAFERRMSNQEIKKRKVGRRGRGNLGILAFEKLQGLHGARKVSGAQVRHGLCDFKLVGEVAVGGGL